MGTPIQSKSGTTGLFEGDGIAIGGGGGGAEVAVYVGADDGVGINFDAPAYLQSMLYQEGSYAGTKTTIEVEGDDVTVFEFRAKVGDIVKLNATVGSTPTDLFTLGGAFLSAGEQHTQSGVLLVDSALMNRVFFTIAGDDNFIMLMS